nr:MAG TPA: hypothetical protein [Bacteriophage sp.]
MSYQSRIFNFNSCCYIKCIWRNSNWLYNKW